MGAERLRGEFNISKIPVEGVGGLGLLVMAAVVVWALPALRVAGVAALIGGAATGAMLIAGRRWRH